MNLNNLITAGLFKSLTDLQQQSINAIIDECSKQDVTDTRQVAYILATAYHECYNPKHPDTRLTPMIEFGGDTYLRSKKYWPYVGRGFSQLAWLDNYRKETKHLGLPLIEQPELMLQIPFAANSHVYCMVHGIYTGKKLSDYINASGCDFVNARRIVNGIDKAELISEYAGKFLEASQ